MASLPPEFYRINNLPHINTLTDGIHITEPSMKVWVCDETKCEKYPEKDAAYGYIGDKYVFSDGSKIEGSKLMGISPDKLIEDKIPGFYIQEKDFKILHAYAMSTQPKEKADIMILENFKNAFGGGRRRGKRTVRKCHSRKRNRTSKHRSRRSLELR
jgi:hypothetical protein